MAAAPSRRQLQSVIRSIQSLVSATADQKKELHTTVDTLDTWKGGNPEVSSTAAATDSEPAAESGNPKTRRS